MWQIVHRTEIQAVSAGVVRVKRRNHSTSLSVSSDVGSAKPSSFNRLK